MICFTYGFQLFRALGSTDAPDFSIEVFKGINWKTNTRGKTCICIIIPKTMEITTVWPPRIDIERTFVFVMLLIALPLNIYDKSWKHMTYQKAPWNKWRSYILISRDWSKDRPIPPKSPQGLPRTTLGRSKRCTSVFGAPWPPPERPGTPEDHLTDFQRTPLETPEMSHHSK